MLHERWKRSDNRNIRSVGVDPSLFVEVYVDAISETVLVEIDAETVVQFGEFSPLYSRFRVTDEDVEVKVDAESVEFREYGVFSRSEDDVDTRSYQSFASGPGRNRTFDKSNRCGREIEEELREAWAEAEGIYSGMWEIISIEESEHSDKLSVHVSPGEEYEGAEFSVSMDEWDENPSIRKLVEDVASGRVQNLEGKSVWVSMDEYVNKTPISEVDSWNVYCPSDKPNAVSGFIHRLLN